MHRKKTKNRQSTKTLSPQEQLDVNQVGDPLNQNYVQQNLEVFQSSMPQQSFDEIISDRIFEIKKKIRYVKKLFPDLDLDTIRITPEEIFDQDDLRLFKSIKSMLSPNTPLDLSRKLLQNDYPITQLLDDYNLQCALIEIEQQFQLALQDEQFFYPFCCFYTQLWFQDAVEYYIASKKSCQEQQTLNIQNFKLVFSKKFQIINQILNHNTYKLSKKDMEYIKTKTYSMELTYGNDQKIFDCIITKVKQTCIDFNLSLRENEDKNTCDINYLDLTLLEETRQSYQKKFNQEKNRLATILKQSLQLKLRRINNDHLSKNKALKKKSPHQHNQIKKLVEKNQFYIGRKIDQMMYQLIQEEDALIPPSILSTKLNQIQQGIISLMNQEEINDISAQEKYQLIKEKNNNTLKKHTSSSEVKIILEKKILNNSMRQQGLTWKRMKSKYEKKDIRQIINDAKLKKAKKLKKEENRQKFLEDFMSTKRKSEKLEKSFTPQTTKEKTSSEEESLSSDQEKFTLKEMITKSLQKNEQVDDYFFKEDLFKLEKFISAKINQRLKFSLKHHDNQSIDQVQQYIDEFNQNLHQLPISIIKELISKQEIKKQFLYNLMTRLDQIDFQKNEIYIEILKNLKLNKQDVQIQLEQINLHLEEKYTNQVHNYLQQLQPLIQNFENQQNFIQLIQKNRKKQIEK